MSKKQTTFRLNAGTLSSLDNYKLEHHLTSRSDALEKIVEGYQNRENISATELFVQSLSKQLANQVSEELSKTLTRIRLGANNADRNSEIILLALNQLLACSTFKAYIEKETPQMTKAKEIVKERIENFRQKKISKEVNSVSELDERKNDSPISNN